MSDPVASSPNGRASRLLRRALIWTVTLVPIAGWFNFLRPTIWSGPLTYIVIRGTSMVPTYQPGDLVLVERQDSYGPGDIVAYRVPDEQIEGNLILIHRIIGGSDEEGFTLLGDNNEEVDIWYPKESEIVGKPVLRIPAVGLVLTFLRAPLVMASLAAGAAVAVVLVPKSSGGAPAAGRHVGDRRRSRFSVVTRHGAHVA